MKLLIFCAPVIFMCLTARAQNDSVRMKTGIAVNAGELIDILREEANMRIAFEYGFSKKYAVVAEPGIYFTGSGYNVRLTAKKYLNHTSVGGSLRPSYVAVSYFYKRHFDSPGLQYYSDSTHSAVVDHNVKVYVEKWVNTVDLSAGYIVFRKAIYFDWYIGAGVRFKNIGGITRAQYDMMEDNIGRNTMMPGHSVVPDVNAGLRIGWCMSKRR